MKLARAIYGTPARYRKWRGYGFRRMDALVFALKYTDY
jgi:hypothetical protein